MQIPHLFPVNLIRLNVWNAKRHAILNPETKRDARNRAIFHSLPPLPSFPISRPMGHVASRRGLVAVVMVVVVVSPNAVRTFEFRFHRFATLISRRLGEREWKIENYYVITSRKRHSREETRRAFSSSTPSPPSLDQGSLLRAREYESNKAI